MATVKRRGRGWQATVRVDGRERTKTFTKKVDADRWAATSVVDAARGQWIDPRDGRVTFQSIAEQWRKSQPHRPNTARQVEQNLRLHVYPVIGERPIGSIRTSELQALVARLSVPLAPTTLVTVWGRVVAVFKAALTDRLIASSPCVGVKLPKISAPSLEVLDAAQVHAIAEAMPARYRALVIAGAGLGLRPGELFGLAVDRVDFLRRAVRVDQQIVRSAGGGVTLGPLKTPASYRTVPLPDVVSEALAAHLAQFPPSRALVFAARSGSPLNSPSWAPTWTAARRRAGAPSWATPHDLRHFYASLLIRSGASVKVVQARLGHASAVTTLDTYGHLWGDDEDRTRTAVDSLFGRADTLRTAGASDA